MKKLMMIVFAAALLVSCRKDDEEKPTVYPDYANLKVGNYWVYQHFAIDTLGVETALAEYDSCYVEKDTVFKGNTYYKMLRPRKGNPEFHIYYWRDSLGYVINITGKICFSDEDFTTVFDTVYNFSGGDTVYVSTTRMVNRDKVINTPAGDFVTRTFQKRYDIEEWLHATTPRFSNMRFAKDIGIVSETLDIYASNPNYTERRLVRYGNAVR